MTDPKPNQALVKAKQNIEAGVDLGSELVKAMGMTTEQFARIAINALIREPKLAKCSAQSLKMSVLTCAQDGLIPDGVQAALVPYGDEVQYIPMFPGLLTLAREAIPNISISVKAIFKGDEYEYEEGLEPRLIHRPMQLDTDTQVAKTFDNLIAVYAIARYSGSQWAEFEVMSKADILAHKDAYVKALRGPWSHPLKAVEMAKKTVLLRLLKRLPRRGKLANALDRDSEYHGNDFDLPDEKPVPESKDKPNPPEPRVIPGEVATPEEQPKEPEDMGESDPAEPETTDAEAQSIAPGVI